MMAIYNGYPDDGDDDDYENVDDDNVWTSECQLLLFIGYSIWNRSSAQDSALFGDI